MCHFLNIAVKFLEFITLRIKLPFQTSRHTVTAHTTRSKFNISSVQENLFQMLYSKPQSAMLIYLWPWTLRIFNCKLHNQACLRPDLHSWFSFCFFLCSSTNELKVTCPLLVHIFLFLHCNFVLLNSSQALSPSKSFSPLRPGGSTIGRFPRYHPETLSALMTLF